MANTSAPALLGRALECDKLERLLANVRRGQSGVLVVRGEAGIGKTALMRYAALQASEFRVAQITGVEVERELPFAGVHQLCAPMLDQRNALPEPQRNALSVALGLATGDAPDRFLVALAVLSLLAVVAEEQPLACFIDDAQWLDAVSDQVLGFVARRLLAESVALVFAVREPTRRRTLDGVPELLLGGLDDEDARTLLASTVAGRLDEQVGGRLVAETRGNPLALLELAHTMSAGGLAGGFELPAAGGGPDRIEEHYERHISELPATTQRLLLLAAADPTGDPALVWRAAHLLGLDSSAIAAAETEGLLIIRAQVKFGHPLMRSAVYRAASAQDCQAVHCALAEVTDSQADPDRRAWHLAAATSGPDEEVALALEQSAARASSRGGIAAAAACLERAFALTPDPARRVERALAAADASAQAGAFEAALDLVATADAGALDELQSARVDLLRGRVAFASGKGPDAPGLLLKAARRLESLDTKLARETYLSAWCATFVAGEFGGEAVLVEICRAVQALPPRPEGPQPLDLLLDGLALLTTGGHPAATPTLRRAARALTDIPLEDILRWGAMAMAASNAIWDNDGARTISTRQVQLVRDAGALGELPLHLSALGLANAWNGDFAAAASNIAEAESVAAATGSQLPPWVLLRLRALQGTEAEASAAIAEAIEVAATGVQVIEAYAHWAGAVLYNGLGRYGDALSSGREAAFDASEPWVSVWALPELVEAAARAGDSALARDALERLERTTQPSGSDAARGIEARCRALVHEGEAADAAYREAIERLSRTQLGPELARAHLLYGEWLRREGRRIDAREQLRTAHRMMADIGMEAFAERARRELAATGETVRKRTPETRDELTPQERQIAVLARDGLTNPEIGAQLFLSPRTVEWHLHKVFAKLEIRSRRELLAALPESGGAALPA